MVVAAYVRWNHGRRRRGLCWCGEGVMEGVGEERRSEWWLGWPAGIDWPMGPLSHSWLSPSQSKTWESTDIIILINTRQKVSFYRKINALPVFEGISQHKQINNLAIVVTLRVG